MRALSSAHSLAVVAALCVPALAYAQASITGVVKDSSGAVLPGVTVEAASPALIEKVRSAVTDSSGQYHIENLRPGTYSLTFTSLRIQHDQARRHRADRIVHRDGERRHEGRRRRGDDRRHRRDARRRRRQREAAADRQRRDPRGDSDGPALSQHRDARPGRLGVGLAGRRRARGSGHGDVQHARRSGQRRTADARRPVARRVAERHRRVVHRRRRAERAGNRIHDGRRPWRDRRSAVRP